MRHTRTATFSLAWLLPVALLMGACLVPAEPEIEEEQEYVPVFANHALTTNERIWTTRFSKPAVMIADEIRVEGPSDLLSHIAIAQDPTVYTYDIQTIADGLQQVITLKEGIQEREVRAQIDGWTLVGMHRIVVLQRPGEAPVRIQGLGNAALLQGDEEQRSGRIVVRGDHVTP